jgi:ribosomal protein S18 acetylase RimI-like enzyme
MRVLASIRQLTPEDDLDRLIALSSDFFEEYSVHHKEVFQIDELTEEDIRDYFSRFIGTDNGAAFVATVEGEVVGYITVLVRRQARFWRVKRVGSISGLMVSTDHRRRGIATALLAEARAFFRSRGVEYFTTYTAVVNRAAVEFFEQSGMIPFQTTFLGEASPE